MSTGVPLWQVRALPGNYGQLRPIIENVLGSSFPCHDGPQVWKTPEACSWRPFASGLRGADGHDLGSQSKRRHGTSDRCVAVLCGVLVAQRGVRSSVPGPVHQLRDRRARGGRPREGGMPQVVEPERKARSLQCRQPHALAEVDPALVPALWRREE